MMDIISITQAEKACENDENKLKSLTDFQFYLKEKFIKSEIDSYELFLECCFFVTSKEAIKLSRAVIEMGKNIA